MRCPDERGAKLTDRRTVMSIGSAVLKLCVVFSMAILADVVLGAHTRYGYSIGLVLGAILQHFIPPREKPRIFILILLLTFGYAIVRAVLR